MSANKDTQSVIVNDLCLVRVMSGYTLATTDNPRTIATLYGKIAQKINVNADILPIIVGDNEEAGCGRYVICAIPNTCDDEWDRGYGMIWFPTKDEDTYVVANMVLTVDHCVVTLLWAGLVFLASDATWNGATLPVFGMMSKDAERE